MTNATREAIGRVVDYVYGDDADKIPTDTLKRQLHLTVRLLEELGLLPKGEGLGE